MFAVAQSAMLTHSEAAMLVVWNAQNNLLSVPVADRAYWPAGSVTASTVPFVSSSTGSSVPVLPVGIAVGAVVLLGLVLLFFLLARARKRKSQPGHIKPNSIQAMSVRFCTFRSYEYFILITRYCSHIYS